MTKLAAILAAALIGVGGASVRSVPVTLTCTAWHVTSSQIGLRCHGHNHRIRVRLECNATTGRHPRGECREVIT